MNKYTYYIYIYIHTHIFLTSLPRRGARAPENTKTPMLMNVSPANVVVSAVESQTIKLERQVSVSRSGCVVRNAPIERYDPIGPLQAACNG